jgi:hypothetical protein
VHGMAILCREMTWASLFDTLTHCRASPGSLPPGTQIE